MYIIQGNRYDEDPKTKLGGGSEGTVYVFPDDRKLCVKIFHPPEKDDQAALEMAAYRAKKIKHICGLHLHLPDNYVVPSQAACDARGNVIGYMMKRIPSGYGKIMELLKADFRANNDIDLAKISLLYAEIIEGLEKYVHPLGFSLGDINTGGTLISSVLKWAMVDVDSWDFGGNFPCLATTELFCHPDLYPNLEKSGAFIRHQPHHDRFSFTVMYTLMALSGAHPFRMGIHPKYPSLRERAKHGVTIFDSSVKYPSMFPSPELLSDELLDAIIKILKRKTTDPLDVELLRNFSKELIVCPNCNAQYHSSRTSCPKCKKKTILDLKIFELLVETIFQTQGTLLFVQVIGDKLNLACRVNDELKIVIIDQQKNVSVIDSGFEAKKGSRYRFFSNDLVVCEKPNSEPPVKLLIYRIDGGKLVLADTASTTVFANDSAMFESSSNYLYRIAGNMLMCGKFTQKFYAEIPVMEVFSTQTWFAADRISGTDREVLFGFDDSLRNRRWFIISGDGKKFLSRDVDVSSLRVREKLEDFSVYFNQSSALLIRLTSYQGKPFARFAIIGLDGKVISEKLLGESDEGFDYWRNLDGKLFQKSSILHLNSDEGVVKYDIASGVYSTVKGTEGIAMADDRLLRFGTKILMVRRNSILGISPKKNQ